MGLPWTVKRYDVISIIVDRLMKTTHFILVKKNYSLSRLVKLYIKEIVRLHGIPSTIVSNRDSRFTSHFRRALQDALGTQLQFSMTFHPQTDGQTKWTIQTLEDMLRAYVIDFRGS